MYDLLHIIETKIDGMDRLISRWMTNENIKLSLINDIKQIKLSINQYHNKYIICKNWKKYGKCKYGTYCWYLHQKKKIK